MRYRRAESPAHLNGPEAAGRFLGSYISQRDSLCEQLLVAHVDSQARCIHVECYQGAPTAVGLPVREIVADALRLGSAGVIVAHNHPSGDLRPSKADFLATRKLVQAGAVIDLAILDHLVFGARDFSSMRRMGLL